MTVVVDASVVVAALVDDGDDGRWAEGLLVDQLAAPHLLPVETANVLRRLVGNGELGDDLASLAHADLRDLPLQLFPYDIVADRIWALRANLTSYDAWYVALAELLEAPLATLDVGVVRSPGTHCRFLTPES